MKTITEAQYTREGDIILKLKEVGAMWETEKGPAVSTKGKEETVIVPIGYIDGQLPSKDIVNERVYAHLSAQNIEMFVKKFNVL